MCRNFARIWLIACGYLSACALPAHADAIKCSDAKQELIQNIDPLVDVEVRSGLPTYATRYKTTYEKFYVVNETDNMRKCAAVVRLSLDDGLTSESEIRYRIVATEDGQTLTQFQQVDLRGLVAGILMASLRKTQSGMPADQAAKEFYAPQGPGSFADQVRKYNREGSVGARKSAPRE